jgi:hypothetical protein
LVSSSRKTVVGLLPPPGEVSTDLSGIVSPTPPDPFVKLALCLNAAREGISLYPLIYPSLLNDLVIPTPGPDLGLS